MLEKFSFSYCAPFRESPTWMCKQKLHKGGTYAPETQRNPPIIYIIYLYMNTYVVCMYNIQYLCP